MSEAEKKRVDDILKSGRFSKKRPVVIRELGKIPGGYYKAKILTRIAKENDFENASAMLASLGWTMSHRNEDATLEGIMAILKQTYPEADIEKAMRGEIRLPNIGELRAGASKKAVEAYIHRAGRNSEDMAPIKGVINSLYPQFPELYRLVAGKVHPEPDDVGEKIRQIFATEGDISPAGLKRDHPDVHKAVHAIYEHRRRHRRRITKTKIIEQLSRIPSSEFTKSEGKWKIGEISEMLTKFLLMMTQQIDPSAGFQTEQFRETFPLPIRDVSNSRGCRVTMKGRAFYPDILVISDEACIVEVANYSLPNKKKERKILDELGAECPIYFSKNGSGRFRAERRVAVIHGANGTSEAIAGKLSDANPRILTFPSAHFEKSLDRVLEEAGELVPAELLREIARTVCYSPHLIMKKSQKGKLAYAKTLLRKINAAILGSELPFSAGEATVFGRRGKEARNEKGKFRLYRVPLSAIEETPTTAYVMANLRRLGSGKRLYLDLETTGLSKDDQIVSAGLAYVREGEFIIDAGFARNPWEEAALLQYVSKMMGSNPNLITYNGKSFDVPRMESRFGANLIRGQEPKLHTDIYKDWMHGAAGRMKLRDGKLSQIDRMLGYARTDIPGKLVPRIYHSFLYSDTPYNGLTVSEVLEHNCWDMISLAAAHIFARKEMGFRY